MQAQSPSQASRCLVTGASGFIGSRLCERWSLSGRHDYVAMVRRAEAADRFRSLGRATAIADVTLPRQVEAALSGCHAVVHLALAQNGVEGTRVAVERSIAAGVRRFVHISSMAVHGPSPGPEATVEETAQIGHYGHEYSDSKAEQELIVQSAIDRGDLDAVILRPTIVYGPDSYFVVPVLEEARRGQVIVVDDGVGVCNAVYIDDVCDAIDAALAAPAAAGQAFFVNGDDSLTWHDFIAAFARLVSPEPMFHNLSSEEVLAFWAKHPSPYPRTVAARAYRKLRLLTGLTPRVAPWPMAGRILRETVRVRFSNAKAKRVLGWAPSVSFEQGVGMTREWLESSRRSA